MADSGENNVVISSSFTSKLLKWRVSEGQEVKERSVLAIYEKLGQSDKQKGFITQPKLKSNVNGRIKKLLVSEGDVVPAGKPVIQIEQAIVCEHNTVMKDLCCDCGMDLRLKADLDEPSSPTLATVSMIHNIPELRVTQDEAEAVGKKDEDRLLNTRKLALVVDLDQTMIHTTIELVPADMKGVYHFNLSGYPLWYHTKFRPFAHEFLERISKLYELHIFTMGSRLYAHTIARMLDPDESLFGHRIRSRDDCFNAFSKSNDLRSLFPRGDSMVCIIDDRIDVWNNAPNLIKVKPYQFFKGVGDINAPSERQHETTPDALESDEKNEKEENEVKCKENITDTEVDPGEKPDKIETTPDALESDEKNEKEENEVKCKENITDTEVDPGEKPDKIDALDAGDVNTKDSDDVKEEDMRVEMDVNSPSSKPENTSCESIKANMDNKEMCQDDSDSKSSLESKQSGEESNDDIKGEGIESTRTDDETKQDIKVTSKTETALESNQDNKTMELNPEVINSEKEAKELCNVSEEPDEAENCTFVVESQEGKKEKSENLGNGLENADGQEACNIDDEQTEVKNTSNVKNIKDHTDMSNNNNGSNGKVQEGESNAEKNDVQKAQTAENGRQEQKTSNAEETGKPQPSDSTSDRQYHVDDDDYLVHLEDILRRIHDKFYSTVDQIKELKAKGIKEADSNIARYCSPGTLTPCTKQIIKELQSQVLKGTNIAFTGVIPTNIQPEKSEIWQRTLRLGAKISRHVVCPKDARHPGKVTTHVIAARLGTEKTYRAMKTPGIKLVKPDWLWCCEERWEWVEERLFSVDGIDKYKKEVRNQRTPQGTPQNWKKSIKTEKNTEVTDDKDETNTDVTTRERTCSSSSADLLMASLHPLLSFSSTEMAAMDKEVEELMNSSADESDVIGSISGSSSSGGSSSSSSSSSSTSSASDDEDGNTKLEDSTKKRRMSDSDGDGDDNLSKKRKEELSPNSDESDDYTRRSSPSDDDDDDDGDDDDDMAALLEAELSHD